ncbi:MAG TPA: TonB-dependent receptor [Ignavibacteriales bacterium]|nr:TonB-dependent receptor [Ignavibacteriales bacterium]
MEHSLKRASVIQLIAILLFIPVCASSYAQLKRASVDGIVVDDKSNERLEGISIISDGTLLAASGSKGYFSFSLPPGTHTLMFKALGYKELIISVDVDEDENEELFPRMIQQAIILDSVTVTGFREQDAGNVINLQPGELTKIPQFGEVDALKGFLALPGVTTTTDFSSQLSIRGGNYDETTITIDGVPLYNPYHLAGVFSVFNSDILKSENLYLSNYPVSLNGGLSGLLDLRSKQGGQERFRGNISLGLASSKASLYGPLLGGSVILSYRRTYLDLLGKMLKFEFPYSFDDTYIRYSVPFEKDNLSISLLYSGDTYVVTPEKTHLIARKTKDPQWGNSSLSFSYSHSFSSNSGVDLAAYSSQSSLGLEAMTETEIPLHPLDTCKVNNFIKDYTFKAEFYSIDKNRELRFGYEIKKLNISYNWNIDTTDLGGFFIRPLEEIFYDYSMNPFSYSRNDLFQNFYASGKIKLDKKNTLTAGFRSTIDGNVKKFYFLPYISLESILQNNLTGNLSYGRHVQYLYSLKEQRNEALLSPFSALFLADNGDETGVSDNLTAGFLLKNILALPLELKLDGYYSIRQNIPSSYPKDEIKDRYRHEDGYSFGMDVLLKHDSPLHSGWIAYSFLRSVKRNEKYAYFSQFDRTHSVKAISNIRFFDHWHFSIFFTFATGLPYTPPAGKYVGGPSEDDTQSNWREIKGRINSARFKNFHRMDLGINGSFIWGMFLFKPYVQVLNLYGSENPFIYEYETYVLDPKQGERQGSYVIPTFGITVEF